MEFQVLLEVSKVLTSCWDPSCWLEDNIGPIYQSWTMKHGSIKDDIFIEGRFDLPLIVGYKFRNQDDAMLFKLIFG